MLIGSFQSNVKRLNKNIRFLASGSNKPISLCLVKGDEIEHICGTDRNETPEFPIYDKQGHIVKSGWRRVLMILLQKKLISKPKAEILFSTVLDGRRKAFVIEESSVDRALKQAAIPYDDGGLDMKKDDLMDIAAMIRQERDKERTHAC